ncbi:hypothetical protein AZE42_04107 [Rhizopogon vesiculosus]|uniref:F-box domain-containing protein n=1 Tax=Rhizopogon vesiculosus TaxID=180088 RepID=A0A1J8R395_9AGAM|nr:hypothetical protein AZE42_04107 [Rhizopogon vesiculosus]
MTKASAGFARTKHIFPISSLPDELLLHIFQALVNDMYCADDELRLDCLILTSVCYRWRSLVLGTPRFWTRLHMVARSHELSSTLLETYVKRSANALVDVIIYLPCPPNSRVIAPMTRPPAFPRTEACLKVLQDCSHRWKSLRVRIIRQENDYIMTDLFNLVLSKLSLSHAPALHKIEIICPSNLRWVTFVAKSFHLLSSPSLRNLTLEGNDSKILPRHFDTSSLTHLSLNFIMEYDNIRNSHIAFRSLLLSARNLMSLEVHPRVFRVEHAETSGELDPVMLPVLRTLNIFMDTEKPAYLSGILGVITAPNLLHFAVYSDSHVRDECSLLNFSSFLLQDQAPKFPSVRKLTMKNVLQSMYGPGKNIHRIFTAFPHVTDVVLDQDIREVADFLALESYDKNAPPLWPCLQQLTIEMPCMTKFHYIQQLLEWLRLRRASRLSLPAVVIRYDLQGPGVNDARDLTAIRRIVNDATGYRASETKKVVKQLGKLNVLVDLRVTDEWFPCR